MRTCLILLSLLTLSTVVPLQAALAAGPHRGDGEKDVDLWAFQPLARPAPPTVDDPGWTQSTLDRFILAELERNGLGPAPPADKAAIIRRATLDLTGLPPTPADFAVFQNDHAPDAFVRVVDRLLASPAYGERWGRHWLDVARYADSNGLDENIAHGNAWRYRDYVVAAMNADKSYDQFVREQLAGDLLPTDNDQRVVYQRLIATGFLSLGPKVLAEGDERKMEMDIIDEQLSTITQAMMAVTLGCARCHDHKFDPFTVEDYYALAGVLKSTRTMESLKRIARWHENPIPTDAEKAAKIEHQQRVRQQETALKQLIDQANAELVATGGADFKLPDRPDSLYSAERKSSLQKMRKQLEDLKKSAPTVSSAMGVRDGEPEDLRVHFRGDPLSLGEAVPRRFPKVLSSGQRQRMPSNQSGRLELANWLLNNASHLTSRVISNRIWRWHFGQGLCSTPDNVGRLGAPPTNALLLDWLSNQLIQSAWSIKSLHRTIMLSSTYQMSSQHDPRLARLDPENRFHWRANIRRLEAEAIRDCILAVTDTLDREMGGSLLHVKNREFLFDHTSRDETKYESHRRSLYLPVIRNHLYKMFELFDYADASVSNGNRATTTVAPQALFMMNSPLIDEATESMARSLLNDFRRNDTQRVQRLYARAYSRPATNSEVARALEFVKTFQQVKPPELQDGVSCRLGAWQALCHAMIAANEFVYIR